MEPLTYREHIKRVCSQRDHSKFNGGSTISTPTPQSGYNPYGPAGQQGGQPVPQGQQPAYGQPPYGQQPGQPPYGQAPGQPGQPQFGQPQFGGPTPPMAPPPMRGSRGLWPKIKIVAAVVLLIGVGVFYLLNHDTMPASAVVGDCMHNSGTESNPDLEIVKCGDSKAQFKVTQAGDDAVECKDDESSYEETRKGRVLTSLCLTSVG
jgi:hypothetical protein